MPPRVVTLVSGLGWHVQDLERAARLLDIDLAPVPFSSLRASVGANAPRLNASDHDLRAADGILVRLMPAGTLEQVVFRMDTLHRLEAEGQRIINPPRAVEAAVDKYLALARLELHGLPVPPTWVGESADAALDAFDRLGRDVVVKPLFGSEGRGLMRVSDPDLALRAFRTLEQLGAVLYLQKFLRHDGEDLRILVIRDHPLGCMRRRSTGGDWRTNVARGASPEMTPLDPAIASLALRASKAVGAVVSGVDIVLDRDTGLPYVLEVNAVPGWRAFSAVSGLDVAVEILSLFRS